MKKFSITSIDTQENIHKVGFLIEDTDVENTIEMTVDVAPLKMDDSKEIVDILCYTSLAALGLDSAMYQGQEAPYSASEGTVEFKIGAVFTLV